MVVYLCLMMYSMIMVALNGEEMHENYFVVHQITT
jgi:hypothetical protein